MALNIVLVEPEIPQNTGNIARTCAAINAVLHLVKPLGFSIDDRYLKRAGLDYWDSVNITIHESLDDFLFIPNLAEVFFFTTKARQCYTEVMYPENCFLLFGKESKGLPEQLLAQNPDSCVRIPMANEIRSLNLSNSAAIAAYEYHRQREFSSLLAAGNLHTLSWD